MSVESELNGINVDDVPISRRKSLKKRKKQNRHFSKKLLSEEFDIEENVPDARRGRKLGEKGDNKKLEDEETNYNTVAYHKKQHKI